MSASNLNDCSGLIDPLIDKIHICGNEKGISFNITVNLCLGGFFGVTVTGSADCIIEVSICSTSQQLLEFDENKQTFRIVHCRRSQGCK